MTSRPPLLLFGLLLFLISADQFCILPLLPLIERDLGLGTVEACFLVTAYHAASGFFGLFIGRRLGRARLGFVFLSGLALFMIASLFTIIVDNFPLLFSIRLVAGLGASAIGLGVTHYIATAVPPQSQQIARGFAMGGGVLGLIVGPLAVGTVAMQIDWHWIYALFCAAMLPTFPFAVMLVRQHAPSGMPPEPPTASRLGTIADMTREYAGFLRRRTTLIGAAIAFLFAGAVGGIMSIFGLWLAGGAGPFDAGSIAKVFAAAGLGVFMGDLLGPRVTPWIGPHRVVLTGSVILAACFAALYTSDRTVASVYVTFFIVATVESLRRGPLQLVLARLVAPDEIVSYTMLTTGASQAGMAVCAPVMGIMLGFDRGVALTWPCILAVGLTALATIGYSVVAGKAVSVPREEA